MLIRKERIELMVRGLLIDFEGMRTGMIPCVKAVRALTGWDLKESKQLVDKVNSKMTWNND